MRFCFYLGYKDIKGGYTTLLLTLVRELKKQNYEVVLFNYSDGLIVNELKKDGIELIIIDLNTVNWKEIDQFIFPTDIIIASKFLEIYKHLFSANPKFIFYDINDFICNISDYKYGIKLPFLGKKLVNKLLQKKSLLFMDDTGVLNLKNQFSLQVDAPQYLPIPVQAGQQNLYINQNASQDALKLTYIGRAVDWKMMPLKKILQDCSKIKAGDRSIHFTIVVDNIKDFYKFIDLDSFTRSQNHTVRIIENMLPSEIDHFLLTSSDLHFAMGTAALEAAKLGIPTILVDYSRKEFPENYIYRWLYQTENFSLGKNIDKLPLEKGVSLQSIFSEFQKDPSYRIEQSKRSFEYVRSYHASEKVVNKLIEIAKSAEFRIRDSRRFIPYFFRSHQVIKAILKMKPIK